MSRSVGFAPSFWINVGTSTDITLSYYYLKTKDVTDYGQPTLFTNALGFLGFPPVSPENYYGYANYDFADYETHIGTFTVDHRFSDTLTLRNTLRLAKLQARIRIDDLDVVGHRCRRCASDPRHAAVAVVGHPQP